VLAFIVAALFIYMVLLNQYLSFRRLLLTSLYWLPCIALAVYSLWFLQREPRIAK
jgi:hypothetical protein